MVEDIEKIRKDAITGIKEKANGYNDQECLKELEKYEFVNGLDDLKESKRL